MYKFYSINNTYFLYDEDNLKFWLIVSELEVFSSKLDYRILYIVDCKVKFRFEAHNELFYIV